MKPRNILRAATGLSLVLITTLTLVAAPSQAAKEPTVFWLNLSGTSSVAPKGVFFTANSGGYMRKIKWTGWGTNKTVGRGIFRTSSPCGGELPACPNGMATMILRKPVKCHPEFGNKEGKEILVYRHGRINYPQGDGTRVKTSLDGLTGWGACKEAH